MSEKTIGRLSEVIRQRAANLLLTELKDPRLGFVTITRVKLVPDLSSCVIYYSVLGTDGDKSRTRHGLADARGFIQRQIAKSLKTRTAPHINFEYDESVEGAQRMQDLLRNLSKERSDSSEAQLPDPPDSES